MTDKRWRYRIAWLFIAAYLPMLIASVLHSHPLPGNDVCYDCSHHIDHPAHFSSCDNTNHNCLYCHLLSLPKAACPAAAVVVAAIAAVTLGEPRHEAVLAPDYSHARLRAPPSV